MLACIVYFAVLWLLYTYLWKTKVQQDLYIPKYLFVSVAIVFISPFIYEFNSIPYLSSPQYRIVRNSSGKITNLVKNGTGFHWPLCSGSRFVCIPNDIPSYGNVITYRTSGVDWSNVTIKYKIKCKDYPTAYILSNGVFSYGVMSWIFSDPFSGIKESVQNDFYSCLKVGINNSGPKKFPKNETPTEIYKFVVQKASGWGATNPYGFSIEIESPEGIAVGQPFAIR